MKFRPLFLSLCLLLALSASAQTLQDILKVFQSRQSKKVNVPVLVQPDLTQSEADFLKAAYDATALLYVQDANGNMRVSCTATAVLKDLTGYQFLTASHCISSDYIYYISDDREDLKNFYQVDDMTCGNPAKGLDACLLHISTPVGFPVVAVGESPTGVGGQAVVAISSPLGLGRQVFRGFVATPHIKRPVLLKDKEENETVANWHDYMLLQMPGVNPAASGSSLICMDQRAICGVIVGTMSTPMGAEAVALPIDRVVKMMEVEEIAVRQAKK